MRKSGKQVDPLIGHDARINPAATYADGTPHPFAGQVVSVLTRNAGGNYQVQMGDEVKVVHLSDVFPIVDPGDGTGRTSLIEDDPALAVNSLTNPRRRKGLDVDSIADLAASIKMHTQLQAILVRPLPASRVEDTAHLSPRPSFEVVAGERRWRACMLGGMKLTMIVREMSDAAVLEMQLVENAHREDLDAMEEAEGFERMRVELGFTAAQIAERLGPGKGKSYVLKALKLCDMVPAAREAMYSTGDGNPPVLSRSTGLLVARYRPEQQEEVVQFIASLAGPGGEPAAFRDVQGRLAKRYHMELAEAPFDIRSEDLVPAAGACTACPKRTTSQADIFDDATAGPESCTDANCFGAKREAHVVLVRTTAQREGFKVIDGEDARRARPAPAQKHITGYVRLDDVSHTETGADGKEREVTFGDALRGMGKKAPKPRVFIDPHTDKAEKVITVELAEKLQPKEEPQRKKPGGGQAGASAAQSFGRQVGLQPDPADTRPEEEQALANRHVERALMLRMFDAIRHRGRTDAEMRVIAQALLCIGEERTIQTEQHMGWYEDLSALDDERDQAALVRERIAALPAADLAAVVVMAALEVVMTDTWTQDEQIVSLAQFYGVDVLAVRDKVSEDLDRQQAAPLEEGAEA